MVGIEPTTSGNQRSILNDEFHLSFHFEFGPQHWAGTASFRLTTPQYFDVFRAKSYLDHERA